MKRVVVLVGSIVACAAPGAQASVVGPDAVPGVTRPAILIGNNWDGTTDVVDPETFERLARVDVIPDKAEREAEIAFAPDRLGFFLAIRELVGEGNHQYNDDVFSSNDGTRIFVSRPSFADVVAIDLATRKIAWRAPVDGYRADHMAINKAGTRLLVSASTGNVVHELDTATGQRVGGFASGDSPHESVYSQDEATIYHASIGRVYSPVDRPKQASDAVAGGEFFQVVDAKTGEIRKRIDLGQKMEEAGHPGFSSAMRPMALSPDERFVYFQLSFFHGFVEYDLSKDVVTRIARLPIPEATAKIPPEQYLLNSAHHGLALDPTGKKLCIAGTMSDYAAIVDRSSFTVDAVIDGVKKPYWSTNSGDGRYCYVSASQADEVKVISYDTEAVVHTIPVGRHPQRVRNGVVRVTDFPLGKHGEPFRLGVTVKSTRAASCRVLGADRLRLQRCRVQLKRGTTVLGAGEQKTADATAVRVPLKLTAAGRRALRRSPRALRATVSARGVDSVGRVQRTTTRVQLRR